MKKIKSIGLLLLLLIIGLWLASCILPFFIPDVSEQTIRLLGISFSSITALFTGIAFVVAYSALLKQQESLEHQQKSLINQQENLKLQQESLVKQTNLGVFSVFIDSMKIITNSQSFKQCQNYILSDQLDTDKELIRQNLKKGLEDIHLDDYSIVSNKENGKNNEVKRLRINRDKIKTFCMRMEFMGIIISRLQGDDTAEDLILDLYGHTIQKSYRRLESLIKRNDDNPTSKDLYPNYTYLYELAKKREKLK